MTQTEAERMKYWRWRIFAVTYLAYAGFYLCRKNWSIAMPMLKDEFGYTKDQFATIAFSYSLLYMLGQFINGVLSDRFGPRAVVSFGLFASVAVNIAMGFNGLLTGFIILNTLNGYFQATGWSGTVKNMAAWFPHEQRGKVMGVWGTCFVVGGMLSSWLATFATTRMPVASDWGWHAAFFVPAALMSVVAVTYLFGTRNRPSDVDLAEMPIEPVEGPTPDAADLAGPEPLWRVILRAPQFWVAAFSYFFCKLTRYVFIVWLPLYLVEQLGYSRERAGYASGFYEMGFFGVTFAGFMSAYYFQHRRFPISCLMFLGLAVACLIQPTMATLGFWPCVLSIMLIGFMTFGPDSVMSGPAAMDIGSREAAAKAAGWINGVGSIGQLMSPFIASRVSTAYGWDAVFYLFVVFALLGACLTATQWNYGARRESTSPAS